MSKMLPKWTKQKKNQFLGEIMQACAHTDRHTDRHTHGDRDREGR